MKIAGPFTITIPAYPETGAEITTGRMDGRITSVGIVTHSATGDISIKTPQDDQIPQRTIFDKSSVGSDGWFNPRELLQGTDGADITDQYDMGIPLDGSLVITVENANGGDVFDVTFMLE